MSNTQLIETTKKFRQFVEKYDEAAKIHNMRIDEFLKRLRIRKYVSVPEVATTLSGRYRINDDCTIDIDGNLCLMDIYDFTIEPTEYHSVRISGKKPLFIFDDFPFKLNKVSGDFKIEETHLQNLDMFPRLVCGDALVSNRYLNSPSTIKSIKGIAGSVIIGDCIIRCETEDLYFPDAVGGELNFEDHNWKRIHLDKSVYVGGCFSADMYATDPNAKKIKEKVSAKCYSFVIEKRFNIEYENKYRSAYIPIYEKPINIKPFFIVGSIKLSMRGDFLKDYSKSRFAAPEIEEFVKKWLPLKNEKFPEITNFEYVQQLWNKMNPDLEINIEEW